MVLLAEECFSPPLRPELPENHARISNKNEPITSQVRAGCEKKLFQSPQAKMVRPSWMITLTVEMIMMRTLTTVLLAEDRPKENSRKKAQKAQKWRGAALKRLLDYGMLAEALVPG